MGQNTTDFHLGITRVPRGLHIRIRLIVIYIKCAGGTIQLLYFDQSCANASTPEVPVAKNLEKKIPVDTFLLLLSAKVIGPHNLLKNK